ncbi:hypothetical protein CEE69_25350 [Rhodopirellula bahusiensis]|uniref:Uncharacterized protein n=2 Tax=Rhodopirellula bahusiensis TaxID=2014065 RepID=A0A2G1W091_9BACT|nr:hypothetical protein CEE69_25350 [Rhodopirellula bahusiensis]
MDAFNFTDNLNPADAGKRYYLETDRQHLKMAARARILRENPEIAAYHREVQAAIERRLKRLEQIKAPRRFKQIKARSKFELKTI